MIFGLVRAEVSSAVLAEHETLDDAMAALGLERGTVDHGPVAVLPDGCVSIVAWEHGLRADPARTYYASIGAMLIAGEAVLYQTDRAGETTDLRRLPPVSFWGRGAARVERAIAAGTLVRPQVAVGPLGGPGTVVWRWPDPPYHPHHAARRVP